MRVSANWLRELTGLTEDVSIEKISEKLTMAGLEVEGIEKQALGFDKVVVGHIVKKGQHPQADKLSLCEVDVGATDPVQIICGAPNHVEGDWVIAALPGARLANGMEIQHTQIRGVDSSGMLCSEAELGISDQHEGIIILPNDPAMKAGADAAIALERNDTILELGITPNRPDALSHVGVARELTALLETRFHRPSFTCSERGAPIEQVAKVVIDAPEQCPRYACRVVDNVTVAPSPRWLQNRLEKCGIRAINNVVDITNLVLLEIGHPLHAFDTAKLGKDEDGRVKVRVRLAEADETLDTLSVRSTKYFLFHVGVVDNIIWLRKFWKKY